MKCDIINAAEKSIHQKLKEKFKFWDMLNVNKFLIVLSVITFSSSLCATNISNFDIKGIQLGMSKKEVLKLIPCHNPKIHKNGLGVDIECGDIYSKDGEGLSLEFDHKKQIFYIVFHKGFEIEPNWNKIKNRLIQKYGNPNKIKNINDGNRNCMGNGKGYCYTGKRFIWGNYKYGQGLQAEFIVGKDSGGYIHFEIRMKDNKAKKAFYSKNKKYWQKEEQTKKDKASNFDF